MSAELVERVTGVGALIVAPADPDRGFLTIEELRSKRSTNKIIGMRALPMETIEPGETHAEAWMRLTSEEIQLQNIKYNPRKVAENILCLCELRPGVVLYASVLEVSPYTDVIIGSESLEVADLRWTRFKDVLNAPAGDLGIRPGTREVVQAYLAYKINPVSYMPQVYRYGDLQDHIPDKLFEMIESGVSLEESLFRLKLVSEPAVRSGLLAHLQSLQAVPLGSAGAR